MKTVALLMLALLLSACEDDRPMTDEEMSVAVARCRSLGLGSKLRFGKVHCIPPTVVKGVAV